MKFDEELRKHTVQVMDAIRARLQPIFEGKKRIEDVYGEGPLSQSRYLEDCESVAKYHVLFLKKEEHA